MIVLHALWDSASSTLRLFAESSTYYNTASRKAKRTATTTAPLHLFALSSEELKTILADEETWYPQGVPLHVVTPLVGAMSLAHAGTIALSWPSVSGVPLPSPALLVEHKSIEGSPELAAWTLPTLALPVRAAFDTLYALPADGEIQGINFGDSLHFWATAANLAYEFIVRQTYLPTLQTSPNGSNPTYYAAWQAYLSPQDRQRVSALARMMPPLCWASLPKQNQTAEQLETVLLDFLNHCTDTIVRTNITASHIVPAKRGHQNEPLAKQWLRALVSNTPTLVGSSSELAAFAKNLHGWLNQLQIAPEETAFRTCFRLETPAEETGPDAPWQVSFHLQATDDPSLLVAAEQVWRERSSTLTFLKHNFENPQERLLADLAKASHVLPAIEESLHSARPSDIQLNSEQAYRFLRESAPLLEQSGFGVLVPPWWQKNSARVRMRLKLKPKVGSAQASGLLGMNGVVAYDWQIAVGDAQISAKEFERLVRLKQPLVQVRGQWVELRPQEVEAAIAFFKKRQSGQMSLGEALRMGLGQDSDNLGLPVESVEAEGWIDDLFTGLKESKISLIEQPASLQGQLRPYQLKGTSWMAFLKQFGLGACLADDMGLGKCCSADTLISINGMLQTAEDIWAKYAGNTNFDGEGYWAEPIKQLRVNAIHHTEEQIIQTPIKRLYRQHITERMRKIQLEDGSNITITQRHKLLTDKGWTNELHTGDYVCVPAKLVWEGQAEDHNLIKLLAWQIAEGYELQGRSTVIITQKDATVLEELRECLYHLGKEYNIQVNHPALCLPDHKAAYLAINSSAYRRFLVQKGYQWGHLSREKCIPDFIMQADLDSIRVFLQNFFEAEASVVASMCSIEIATASPILIQQLVSLLRRFGIWMRISIKQKCATNGSGILRPYQIGVLGGNALRKFCQEIGFVGSRKRGKLEALCQIVSNTNVEGIPASDIMSQVVASTKLPIRHLGMPTVYVSGYQQFSQTSLQTVVVAIDRILSGEAEQAYREKPASKWTKRTLEAYANLDRELLTTTKTKLHHLMEQEVYYCRIKAIEDIEYDGWVYDFEVEEHHNYVANNILCHNTIQLISLLLHERANNNQSHQTAPTLIVCPMSIVGNWQREIQRFAPSLSILIHHGADRMEGERLLTEASKYDVVITTYSIALRDKEHLTQIAWENVVVDEAQNIKNDAAKQTQAIKQLQANYKVALTGTPVENRLSELWSIMEFLNPGYLGSGEAFRKNFATPIERYHEPDRAETLKRIIQPFVLRRQKTDKAIISDLPDKMEMKVYCNLTREQATLYEAVVKDMMEQIEVAEGMERRGLILATLTKLKQVCNHPAQFMGDGSTLANRSGKLERLEEMLEEVQAEGDKALIFTQYAEMGTMLRQYLQEKLGYETLFLHGGTAKKQRDMMVQRFQEDQHGARFFILSLKAGGVGLNLTAANHVFHFDRWWNPAVENQATDRAFRIGQKRNVQVHKFVCIGTLEERIDMMIEQKRGLAESIVGSGENWLTEMSTTQLKELFALSREAIGE